ncbi:hypothetical protein BDR06DRAFT_976451 [Suillus hirtellus]|nr:hypothetical protein BDR06DRAFT_976451 [Suillus hirtellus]
MTNRKVHFSLPLEIPETRMTATAALARWWGDFVPMDQWTPPKNMIWVLKLRELAAMFDLGWDQSTVPEPEQSPLTDSLMEESEVNELVNKPDADDTSYDLGWHTEMVKVEAVGNQADELAFDLGWDVVTSKIPVSVLDDTGNAAYDLRWNTSLFTQPVYDLGWTKDSLTGHGSLDIPANDCSPVYDLGWSMSLPPDDGMADILSHNSNIPASQTHEPEYDLGWDDLDPDVIELTDRDTPDADDTKPGRILPDEVIDLTVDPPLHDTRFCMSIDSVHNVELKLEDCADMDIDQDARDSSHGDKSLDATPYAFRQNRRLKTIGNTMFSGLTFSQLPAHILMSNRNILGGYAEACNRVTNIGRDMCKLHRLIQLQRHMLKSLDQVIESLEGESQ